MCEHITGSLKKHTVKKCYQKKVLEMNYPDV